MRDSHRNPKRKRGMIPRVTGANPEENAHSRKSAAPRTAVDPAKAPADPRLSAVVSAWDLLGGISSSWPNCHARRLTPDLRGRASMPNPALRFCYLRLHRMLKTCHGPDILHLVPARWCLTQLCRYPHFAAPSNVLTMSVVANHCGCGWCCHVGSTAI